MINEPVDLGAVIAETRQKAVDAYWSSQKTCTLGQAGRVAQRAAEIGDQAVTIAVRGLLAVAWDGGFSAGWDDAKDDGINDKWDSRTVNPFGDIS